MGEAKVQLRRFVQIAVRVYLVAIGLTGRRYRFGWARLMTTPEFGRNFMLS